MAGTFIRQWRPLKDKHAAAAEVFVRGAAGVGLMARDPSARWALPQKSHLGGGSDPRLSRARRARGIATLNRRRRPAVTRGGRSPPRAQLFGREFGEPPRSPAVQAIATGSWKYAGQGRARNSHPERGQGACSETCRRTHLRGSLENRCPHPAHGGGRYQPRERKSRRNCTVSRRSGSVRVVSGQTSSFLAVRLSANSSPQRHRDHAGQHSHGRVRRWRGPGFE